MDDRINVRKTRWRWFDTVLTIPALALAAYLYRGFYFPDEVLYSGASSGGLRLFLLGLRVAFPLLVLLAAFLYWGLRTSRVALSSLGLMLAGSLGAALLVYIPASHFYYNASGAYRIPGYHPYLQLTPPDFRPRQPIPGKPLLNILCLGGSTTQWPDSRGRDWPSRVEETLQAKLPDRSVAVHNQGKEWYTSLHTLINYSTNLREHKPNVLLVMLGINDLMQNADFSYFSAGSFREDYGHFYGAVSRLVLRKSFFANLTSKVQQAWYHEPHTLVHTEEFPGLPVFKRNLLSLIDLARADKARVVLVTEPHLFKAEMSDEDLKRSYMLTYSVVGPHKRWDGFTLRRGLERYNQAVREAALESGAALIDLEAAVPKTSVYFADEVHYQDAAFPLVSEIISRGLLELVIRE